MLELCPNCKRRVLFSTRDGDLVFCSPQCQSHYARPGFCSACMSQSLELGTGLLGLRRGCGRNLSGESDKCHDCGSVIMELHRYTFGFKVEKLGRFRVKVFSHDQYLTRHLREPGAAGVALEGEAAYAWMEAATKLEIEGRTQDAMAEYQRIALKYPHTPGGNDAQKSLESLRARLGID